MAGKSSLDFILNPSEPAAACPPPTHVLALLELHQAAMLQSLQSPPPPRSILPIGPSVQPKHVEEKRFVAIRPKAVVPVRSPISSSSSGEDDNEEDDDQHHKQLPSLQQRKTSKKKTRLCKEPNCASLAVSRRSCVRHGGGSRCIVDGCANGAKLRNKCFQHGGSTICLADGCDSKAKRYGYCWCHGGGRICSSSDGCDKVAAQGGLCWAHGGGNRCRLDGCIKRSYQKHGYFCKRHAHHSDGTTSP